MMMKEIQDAVKKNLSGEIGVQLQKELQDLEVMRGRVEQWEQWEDSIKAELKRLREGEHKMEEILRREAKVSERERDIYIQDAILTVKEGHSNDKVDLMKSVVENVFGNNKYKYSVIENGVRPYGENGCVAATSSTKTVDGEN